MIFMQSNMNEDIFDAVLQRVFCDYTDERLSSYPDCETLAKKYPLPKKEKRAFDRAAKETKYGKSLVRVYLSRVAVIFLCMVALGAGVMMTSGAVRDTVKHIIIEQFEKYNLFRILNAETESNDFESIEDVKIEYIPAGYKLNNTVEIPGNVTYVYSSSEDAFTIEIFENETTDFFPDNEHSQYSETDINGHKTWIVYDKNNGSGSLIMVGDRISVSISGNFPKDELVKIAENIK